MGWGGPHSGPFVAIGINSMQLAVYSNYICSGNPSGMGGGGASQRSLCSDRYIFNAASNVFKLYLQWESLWDGGGLTAVPLLR